MLDGSMSSPMSHKTATANFNQRGIPWWTTGPILSCTPKKFCYLQCSCSNYTSKWNRILSSSANICQDGIIWMFSPCFTPMALQLNLLYVIYHCYVGLFPFKNMSHDCYSTAHSYEVGSRVICFYTLLAPCLVP